jgi:hypothetical protein
MAVLAATGTVMPDARTALWTAKIPTTKDVR